MKKRNRKKNSKNINSYWKEIRNQKDAISRKKIERKNEILEKELNKKQSIMKRKERKTKNSDKAKDEIIMM